MTGTRAGVTVCDFAALLDVLGHGDNEFTSLLYENGANPHTAVKAPAAAITAAAKIPNDANVFFGVNPIAGPARRNAGRGKAEDVTRLAGLWCDLDIKDGACKNLDVARAIVAEVTSIALKIRPSIIVETGHGLHAYWPIEDGVIGDGFTTGQARALVRRFGRLVAVIADKHQVHVDNVYELARMMRIPGTFNNKKTSSNGTAPIPVIAYTDTGGPLTVTEVDERLTELGITQEDTDTDTETQEVSPPAEWHFAAQTCPYVAKIVSDLPSDGPLTGKGRHPWLLSQSVKLACAHRLGCITEDDQLRAKTFLAERFTEIVATTEPRRKPRKYEIEGKVWSARGYGIKRAAAKTDAQARKELGNHEHYGEGVSDEKAGQTKQAKPKPENNGQAADYGDDDEIDEEKFWNAYPQLAECRAYARSVRVAPWAMLGAALAHAAAATPPHVVLPGIVGDYASVNLYVNLPGRSGAIKSQPSPPHGPG